MKFEQLTDKQKALFKKIKNEGISSLKDFTNEDLIDALTSEFTKKNITFLEALLINDSKEDSKI